MRTRFRINGIAPKLLDYNSTSIGRYMNQKMGLKNRRFLHRVL